MGTDEPSFLTGAGGRPRVRCRTSRRRPPWIAFVLALLSMPALVVPCALARPASEAPVAKTPAAPAAPPASVAIPVAEVATRAAQLPTLLSALTDPLAPSAEIDAIRKRLPEEREQIDLELLAAAVTLRSQPTLDVIQAQQQLWQQRQAEASAWLAALTQRATLLQGALGQLAGIKKTWQETREAARASGAPPAILAQIDGVLASVQAAEEPLAAQRTAVLDLQSGVAEQVTRSAAGLASAIRAQQLAMGGILVRDRPPLWSPRAWPTPDDAVLAQVRLIADARWRDVARYVRDPSRGLPLHALALAALTAVFVAARRQVRRPRGPGSGDEPSITVFDRPYSAALIVTLLSVSAPFSAVPQTLRNLSEIVMLVPLLRLAGPAIDPWLLRPAYALAVLFALDSIRQALGGVPVLERALLELEMVAGVAGFAYGLTWGRLGRRPAEGRETERLRGFRVGVGLLLLTLAAGLVAGALGYVRLARLLASALFGGSALALTLYASARVAAGLVALALGAWPLRLLRMVQHHRELLERRTYRLLLWVAFAMWLARLLDYAGLFEPVLASMQALLAAPIGRGSITFSAGDVLEFVLTVWLAYLLSAFIRFVLQEDVYPRTRMTRGFSYAVSSLLNYVVLTLGFVLALGAVGFDLTKVTILAGAFGVGLGFGLQSIVNNFVSGLILLFERPIHVGDIVEMGDLLGEVSRIGIRASTVRTYQGAEIIVPNAQLITDRVTNWTLSDRRRRIDVPVGVDYGSPPEKVVEVLEAVARAHPDILKDPTPVALFMTFGDSSINFELRAWTSQFERWPRIRTDLGVGVYAALRAAGMTIAFPQREVRILHDAGDGAAQTTKAEGRAAGAPGGGPGGGGPGVR
jgi:small-conductance mechanosensitive channel